MYKVSYLVTARQDRVAIKSYLDQYSSIAAMRLFRKIKDKGIIKTEPRPSRTRFLVMIL